MIKFADDSVSPFFGNFLAAMPHIEAEILYASYYVLRMNVTILGYFCNI